MGQEVELNGIGTKLDPNNRDFADLVFDYYNSLNWESFYEKCDENLSKVVEEYNRGLNVFQDILSGKKE